MSPEDDAKRRAALAALAEIPPEAAVLGLGTGSTVRFFIEAIADLVREGRPLLGVPTSEATRALAVALRIPLAKDAGPWAIDLAVDGADEVDRALVLSKGGGGALTREKIVSEAAKRTVIVCDASKLVDHLGQTRPIAIEVLPFGHLTTAVRLAHFGVPTLRTTATGPFRTDNDNLVVDLALPEAVDPAALDRDLRSVPGVVETGIFLRRRSSGPPDVVLVAHPDRVDRLERAAAR